MHDAQQTPAAMILRSAETRGHADHGWLRSAHSFSFAGFHDPRWMGFDALRVINDDEVAGGAGFPMHPHADFEIFSYVLEGSLQHEDSLGNGSVVNAGGIQYMTAGTGVRHSEFNPNPDEKVRFLQIWLVPSVRGAMPGYQTLELSPAEKDGRLKLFISRDGRAGSIRTLAAAEVYAATLNGEQQVSFDVAAGRHAWVQLARGTLRLNGLALRQGDGVAITSAGVLSFDAGSSAEFLIFDLQKQSG